jgi:hypothetical protein
LYRIKNQKNETMKKVLILIAAIVLLAFNGVKAAEKETSNSSNTNTAVVNENSSIKGIVLDKLTSETLAGAVITLNGQKIYTDLDGNFQLNNLKEKSVLKISMISYEDQIINIDPKDTKTINVSLKQL